MDSKIKATIILLLGFSVVLVSSFITNKVNIWAFLLCGIAFLWAFKIWLKDS